MVAHRPDQPKPAGRRSCGVKGLDCCNNVYGWSEKLEYFTDVPWDLPCDCGVGAALGCQVSESAECLHEDDAGSRGAVELARRLREDFG